MTVSQPCRFLQFIPKGVVLVTDENRQDESVTKWSGTMPIPAIGETVVINFNGLGSATVIGYVVEHGWLGLDTELKTIPTWHYRRHPPRTERHGRAFCFGVEIENPKPADEWRPA